MHAYIINMDFAADRWRYVESNFNKTNVPFTRVPGVNGRALRFPIPEYSEKLYRCFHGKRTNAGQVGCYLSHIRALRLFLESSNEYGVICEDDIQPHAELRSILELAIEHVDKWDILRLCGFHNAHPRRFQALDRHYSLAINRTQLCGTGAYMVHRQAAEVLVEKLLPMRVPIDHAIDREWFYGLRAVAVDPLPVSQESHPFESQIVAAKHEKLPAIRRYCTAFPYRAFNELSRWIARGRQLSEVRSAV